MKEKKYHQKTANYLFKEPSDDLMKNDYNVAEW